MLSLDTEAAAAILSGFGEEEIEKITREMLEVGTLEHDVMEQVQKEFMEMAAAGEGFIPDTRAAAEEIVNSAVGEERGREMIGLSKDGVSRRKPFETLLAADPHQIADALKSEHAQTIAQVLSHLKPQVAGAILTKLPEEVHSEVVLRMTQLESASGEMLDRLDSILTKRIQSDPQGAIVPEKSSNKLVAEILNVVGKTVRKKALKEIEKDEPERAKEIEGLMFVFEDFLKVNDASMRKIIMEVDSDTIALALKMASEDLKKRFMDNLSKRAGAMVVETLENLGPKPLSAVEEAQHEIMRAARTLDEQGEVSLRRNEEEQMV